MPTLRSAPKWPALFLDRLTDHGHPPTAVAYASVHAASAEALFAEGLKRRDMRLITGKGDDGPQRARRFYATRRNQAMMTANP